MIKANLTGADTPAVTQRKLAEMAATIRADGGLEGLMAVAIGQVDRYVAATIEVDTGRTKNSLKQGVKVSGNSAVATLSAHTHYAPYVREFTHTTQFLVDAEQVEVPVVLEWLTLEITAQVDTIVEG